MIFFIFYDFFSRLFLSMTILCFSILLGGLFTVFVFSFSSLASPSFAVFPFIFEFNYLMQLHFCLSCRSYRLDGSLFGQRLSPPCPLTLSRVFPPSLCDSLLIQGNWLNMSHLLGVYRFTVLEHRLFITYQFENGHLPTPEHRFVRSFFFFLPRVFFSWRKK